MSDELLKALVESYQPSTETIAEASNLKMLATVGPSASGKSTVMRALAADSRFSLAIGESTRPLRPNEEKHKDMVYRPESEIIEDVKSANLFQVVIGPNGHFYCTRPQDFLTEKINLYPLIPLGVQQFRALPLKFFSAAFIVPASYDLWREWLAKQAKVSNWSPEQLAGRMTEAKASYQFALADKNIRFVLNDSVDKAVIRLRQVGFGQVPDDEELARQIAEANFAKLFKT